MATARELRFLSPGRWCRTVRQVPGARTLAAQASIQIDNQTDFLQKKPHRKHPGILHLPHLRLPQTLASAAQLQLLEKPIPNMDKRVQALTNYLWSRHLPVEPEELRQKAMDLEKKILENPGPHFQSFFSSQTHFRQRRNSVKQYYVPCAEQPTIGKI